MPEFEESSTSKDHVQSYVPSEDAGAKPRSRRRSKGFSSPASSRGPAPVGEIDPQSALQYDSIAKSPDELPADSGREERPERRSDRPERRERKFDRKERGGRRDDESEDSQRPAPSKRSQVPKAAAKPAAPARSASTSQAAAPAAENGLLSRLTRMVRGIFGATEEKPTNRPQADGTDDSPRGDRPRQNRGPRGPRKGGGNRGNKGGNRSGGGGKNRRSGRPHGRESHGSSHASRRD